MVSDPNIRRFLPGVRLWQIPRLIENVEDTTQPPVKRRSALLEIKLSRRFYGNCGRKIHAFTNLTETRDWTISQWGYKVAWNECR